jgi:hypothetical protein
MLVSGLSASSRRQRHSREAPPGLREAYRKVLRADKGSLDYSVLTPLEEELFELLREVTAAFPEDSKAAHPVLKSATRLLERTREHVAKLTASSNP